MTARSFHIGDILSVTTGLLVSPRGMTGVAEIIEFMVDCGPLFDSSLPTVRPICAQALLLQHPGLAEIDADTDLDPDYVPGWLAMQVERFGETLPVLPLGRTP